MVMIVNFCQPAPVAVCWRIAALSILEKSDTHTSTPLTKSNANAFTPKCTHAHTHMHTRSAELLTQQIVAIRY